VLERDLNMSIVAHLRWVSVYLALALVTGIVTGQPAPKLQTTDQAVSTSKTPIIAVAEPAFDFGSVKQGKIVEHEFIISNKGDNLLKIRQVRSSCGCTVGQVKPRTIPPGSTGTLTVKFNTKGRRAKQSKAVYVLSNDPKQPTFTCRITGQILGPDMVFEPASLNFQNVAQGEIHKQSVIFKAGITEKIQIRELSCSLAFLSASMVAAEKKGEVRIEVQCLASAPRGIFTGELRVLTDNKRHPEYRMPVSGRVVGDLIFNPMRLEVGRLDPARSHAWTVYVNTTASREVNLLKVVSVKGNLSLKLKVLKPGKNYRIRVSPIAPREPGRKLHDTIRIHSDSEREPIVEIPFSGSYR